MQRELLYIELQTEGLHRGPAWIALVPRSRSGRTVYFDGRALKRGSGSSSNHWCLESSDKYWISAPKKNGRDRHRFGGGPVLVEQRAVAEYLALRGLTSLDPRLHPIVPDLRETDIERLTQVENDPLRPPPT